MCGIAGVRRLDGAPVDPAVLVEMARRLHHRGPDDAGTWIEGPTGFAHTRLSIIDLGASVQPMLTPDRRKVIAFNGEILNYRQLRDQLDYPFRTSGDTETLLALYDKHGVDSVTKLRGQFAYAINDADTGELHLVRDRLGILPLYYYIDNEIFAFASEIKALLPAIGQRGVDVASLHDYLAHRSVPAPYTLVDGVRKVPQGHRLTLGRDGQVRLRAYWQIPADAAHRDVTPEAAVRLVADALDASIADALVADVPVGAYLSGGIDSSLISALTAKAKQGDGLHTFSAGFGDPRVDELGWARKVADIVGSEHHEVIVSAEDFKDNWHKLSWHRDAPLSEPADVAVFKLAELARTQVKVVLSGEGSDELFGGYPKYRFAQATRWAGLVPEALRGRILPRLERALPASRSRLGVAVRAMGEGSSAERMRGWFAPFTERERDGLLGGPAVRSAIAPYQRGRGDALSRMLYADSHAWLADNLLERGDRMSMAASLELRPPFLDHRLVELAFSLPSSVKVRNGVTKWVVKEVARAHLPGDVVDRAKSGFKVPLDAWFRDGLRDMANDLLTGPSSFVADVLDPTAVRKLLDEHHAGTRNEQPRLWTLLSLEVWHREFAKASQVGA
ncbi:asparagine synthase (glutamine-hydrolyzing) [Actinokineospora globicatena]|uniref:asparagine synthase (glutamine-hydrolyzing) n=1 Tax=Actinokineospora globicatena TaxID=103729 RepID=A0A9W6QL58_9PSEU|nr:asparagine synthase (glutamine-hydrolyzing) [Actinokineospora globicatena]MCP2301594.1 asparagine synthase (glutamine-hydrolyzing) [Actinokineospora globicatena]GLW76752.1 asparagine synthetase B [Actinokineospora globicatena]GLW83585.1 asparagine synthetase B [Actinokineospora globicatena]GLW92468.1 asparagine synthetase B [Actinokineospora globicatena]